MIKKLTILTLFAAVATSCGVNYDGESRLVSQIALVDRNGAPIAGRPIHITVTDDGDYDIISNTVTDANGHALMIFPKPGYDDDIAITIAGDETWQDKTYFNLREINFKDYKFAINTTLFRLQEISELRLTINQIDSDKYLRDIKIDGIQPQTQINFMPSDEQSYFPGQSYSYLVGKNQNITLRYKIYNYDGSLFEERTENVTIGNGQIVNHTITF